MMRALRTIAISLLLLAPHMLGCEGDGPDPNPNFLVIGHRGAPREQAENTVPSFTTAVARGANAIETDLCVTADDEIVIWHDRDPDDAVSLARQAGVEGLLYLPVVPPVGSPLRRPVDMLTLAQLRDGYGYARLLGERDPDIHIPVLQEMLDWVPEASDFKALYLDIKLATWQTAQAAFIVQAVFQAAEAGTLPEHVRVYFISPIREIVEAMETERALLGATTFRAAWDFEKPGSLEGTHSLGLRDASTGLTPAFTWTAFVDEAEMLVEARNAGKLDSVTVWTIDKPKDMTLLLFKDVDAIMTNDPEKLHDFWTQTLTGGSE
jgi:glycerophosphoryl diester phosphodiesterase